MAGTFSTITTITACETTTGFSSDLSFVGTASPGPQGTNFVYSYGDPGIDGDEYIEYDNGSGLDFTGANKYFYIWFLVQKGGKRDKDASNPGVRIQLRSSAGNWKEWNLVGDNCNSNQAYWSVGTFQRSCVDPAETADQSAGTLSLSSIRYFRLIVNYSINHAADAIHLVDHLAYGPGLKYTGGGSAVSPLSLDDARDHSFTNGLGILEKLGSNYLLKGNLEFDSSASDLHFNEQNKSLYVLEGRGTDDYEYGIFLSSDPPQMIFSESGGNDTNVVFGDETSEVGGGVFSNDSARTEIKCTAALTKLKFLGCSFTSYDFDIQSPGNPTFKNSTFTDCGEIPLLTNTFEGNTVADATSGVLMTTSHVSENNNYVGCTDAIKVAGTGPLTVTLDGDTFSGNTDDIHFSGTGTLTVNNTNGADASSSRVSGGGTVVIRNKTTAKVTVKNAAGTLLQNVRVLIEADTGGDLPVGETVTITRWGSTATVSHTAHGIENGKKVAIRGADQQEYNGVFATTYISANSYSYTVSGTPATPATGTIKATGVILSGLTTALGVLEDTDWNYTSNQPYDGIMRLSTTSPYYKNLSVVGTMGSNGFDTMNVMVLDE